MLFRRHADWNDSRMSQFLKSYDDIITAKAGSDFPYPLRMRDWELYHVMSRLPTQRRDISVMDTGAYSTYTAYYLDHISDNVVVSDDFSWADRPEYTGRDVITPLQLWKDAIHKVTPRVRIEHVDLQDIPFPDNTFDYITCISTVEHVPNPARAMTEMVRCLKPGGRLLLTTDHHPDGVPHDGHDQLFNMQQLHALFEPYKDLSATNTPDYDPVNWSYDRGIPIIILFVEVVKESPVLATLRRRLIPVKHAVRKLGRAPAKLARIAGRLVGARA
jgi:SAM-dependent methyltransferase